MTLKKPKSNHFEIIVSVDRCCPHPRCFFVVPSFRRSSCHLKTRGSTAKTTTQLRKKIVKLYSQGRESSSVLYWSSSRIRVGYKRNFSPLRWQSRNNCAGRRVMSVSDEFHPDEVIPDRRHKPPPGSGFGRTGQRLYNYRNRIRRPRIVVRLPCIGRITGKTKRRVKT